MTGWRLPSPFLGTSRAALEQIDKVRASPAVMRPGNATFTAPWVDKGTETGTVVTP